MIIFRFFHYKIHMIRYAIDSLNELRIAQFILRIICIELHMLCIDPYGYGGRDANEVQVKQKKLLAKHSIACCVPCKLLFINSFWIIATKHWKLIDTRHTCALKMPEKLLTAHKLITFSWSCIFSWSFWITWSFHNRTANAVAVIILAKTCIVSNLLQIKTSYWLITHHLGVQIYGIEYVNSLFACFFLFVYDFIVGILIATINKQQCCYLVSKKKKVFFSLEFIVKKRSSIQRIKYENLYT